jgi:hypothetical protein
VKRSITAPKDDLALIGGEGGPDLTEQPPGGEEGGQGVVPGGSVDGWGREHGDEALLNGPVDERKQAPRPTVSSRRGPRRRSARRSWPRSPLWTSLLALSRGLATLARLRSIGRHTSTSLTNLAVDPREVPLMSRRAGPQKSPDTSVITNS